MSEFDYNDFLMFQLKQLVECYEDSKDESVKDWVRQELHLRWPSFYKHLGLQRGTIVNLMPAEDVLKNINTLHGDIKNIDVFAKRLPAEAVIANWDILVEKYGANKSVLFDHVKDKIPYEDLDKWVQRLIPVDKLYYTFRGAFFARPSCGATNYYLFMESLKGLCETPAWDDVKNDLLKYEGNKYVFIDMIERPGYWIELGFWPKDFLKEYIKAKYTDIHELGPREAVWCKYIMLDEFMANTDFKDLIDSYLKCNPQFFGIFVFDYRVTKGSVDKLAKQFIEEIGYNSKYAFLLWELLEIDKGKNLDMEEVARMIAVKTKDKTKKDAKERTYYIEKLTKMKMPKDKIREIFK